MIACGGGVSYEQWGDEEPELSPDRHRRSSEAAHTRLRMLDAEYDEIIGRLVRRVQEEVGKAPARYRKMALEASGSLFDACAVLRIVDHAGGVEVQANGVLIVCLRTVSCFDALLLEGDCNKRNAQRLRERITVVLAEALE